ncbi:MAG: hypothetical protein LKG40_07460 [Lachnospiraceae bacterium]|nr:hypothetical protein [Lachnospiraceae bacterium]MCI1329321.1 hypothetical protein [Lachnospiraceae bacterium]
MAKHSILTNRLAAFAASLATAVAMIAVPQQTFAQDSTESVAMHRLYNPNSGEHFYTASEDEKNSLVKVGWNYEGVGWYAPKSSSTPVYRLYNPNAGDHHYTTSTDERDMLIKAGWNDEGTGWYSSDAQTVPLYRQYNPNAVAGAHNFTKSEDENNHLVSVGWISEGISWYGVRHWVPGHWENTTEQVWVPNVVTVTDTPATTKRVYDHTEYWFEYDGYTTTSGSDCDAHAIALLKAGHPSNFSGKDIYTTQTVPAVTHTEDHGHYETKVTGKKWVDGHYE